MNTSAKVLRGRLGVLLFFAAIAIIVLGATQFQQDVFNWLYCQGAFDARGQWEEESSVIAANSARTEGRLNPADWRRTWRLGFDLGYAAEWLGSYLKRGGQAVDQARKELAPRLDAMERQALSLGLGPIAVLPVRTQEDFDRLPERIDGDELKIASQVESQLSPRHKHLFLLGMHLGAEWARVRGLEGMDLAPDRDRIGRHATLAGVPRSLWEPLVACPAGLDGDHVVANYRNAINDLEKDLETMPGF